MNNEIFRRLSCCWLAGISAWGAYFWLKEVDRPRLPKYVPLSEEQIEERKRRAREYGKEQARLFAEDLREAGLVITEKGES